MCDVLKLVVDLLKRSVDFTVALFCSLDIKFILVNLHIYMEQIANLSMEMEKFV